MNWYLDASKFGAPELAFPMWPTYERVSAGNHRYRK